MLENTVVQHLASLIDAIIRNEKTGNTEWLKRHIDDVHWIEEQFLPSGSGIDNGTKVAIDESKPNDIKLVFGFHHMDDNGMYSGWTEHVARLRPDFANGVDISISGSNRNDIKEHLHEVIRESLNQICVRSAEGGGMEYGYYWQGKWYRREE